MEITALPASALMEKLSLSAARGDATGHRPSHARSEHVTRDSDHACCAKRPRGQGHGWGHGVGTRPGRAVEVLRQELRASLRSELHVSITGTPRAYHAGQDEAADPATLTAEALSAARRLMQTDPAAAARTLDTFRSAVRDAAAQTRTVIGADDDAELDDAVARIDAGLDALDNETATQRAASADVLELDVQTRQRSTLRIRTQEGDLVVLDLRRVDRLSADSVGVSSADGAAAAASIEISSRSRLHLRVEGDLNEAELGAIRDILAQAENAANDFFATGASAGTDGLATALTIDGEQLAAVDLRLRMRQTATLDYTAVRVPQAASVPSQSEPAPATGAPAADVSTAGAVENAAHDDAVTVPGDAADAPPAAPDAPALSGADAPAALAAADNLQLARFLHGVATGFGGNEGGVSVQYHYTQSFKLTLLRAVTHVLAPEASDTPSPVGAGVDATGEDAAAQTVRAA